MARLAKLFVLAAYLTSAGSCFFRSHRDDRGRDVRVVDHSHDRDHDHDHDRH